MDRKQEYDDVTEKLKQILDESDMLIAITGSGLSISSVAVVGSRIAIIKILIEAFVESDEVYKTFQQAVKTYDHIKDMIVKDKPLDCDKCDKKDECDILNGFEDLLSEKKSDVPITPEDVLNKIMSMARPKGNC